VQMLEPRIEESRRDFGIAETTLAKQSREERRQVQRVGQGSGRRIIADRHLPTGSYWHG